MRLRVNKLLIAKGLQRELVYYWFVEDGLETASPSIARLYMLKNAISKGHTNGAMIRVMTPVGRDESSEVSSSRLREFVNVSLPVIKQQILAK